jgi:putative phage-type endonuclease
VSALQLPVRQGTDAWLEARKSGIGSSDIPVIAGESPYRSPYELWAEKTGALPANEPDAETAELFEIGHLMEPVLLELYERRTGRHPKRAPQMRVSRDLPWAYASLDATAPVRRIVEAKWTHSGRWGDAGVPDDVLLQVQWQLFVTGWTVADVVALKGPRPRIVEVERDNTVIDYIVALATAFWERVETRTPPPVDGSEATRQTLVALHPTNVAPALPPTPDLVSLVDQLVEAKARAKAADEDEATVANALRAVIGDADGIAGLVTYRQNAASTRTNWPAVASAYRTLLAEKGVDGEYLDTLTSIHSETSPGPRVLRLSKGAKE